MIKVGDQVVVVDAPNDRGYDVGDVLTVCHVANAYGFWARSINGEERYVRMAEVDGYAEVIVRPYTETEAEKRGAKFGTKGMVKDTGQEWVFVKEIAGMWYGFTEKGSDFGNPSSFRLDHEPKFVEWEDAPEELKYDASRVYYGGKPVKWIANPEGAKSADVVYVVSAGYVSLSSDNLTVKL